MEPGFVKIISLETGLTAEVPESSLPFHYRAGWTLLDESEPDPEPVPEPVRASVVAAADSTVTSTSEEGE